MPPIADAAVSVAPSAERLWTARIVHSALEEGLAKMDMAIATYGRREPLSLFCYGEPGTGKTTLAELFIERYRAARVLGRILYVLLPCPASPSTILEELLDKLGDPFPSRGTVANRMRRCRALFLRERVRLLILDERGNFIDSESGRILLAAASWLKTFMMQIAIPVVALGAGETVYRARDGRLYTTNATAVLGCSTQLSARFQLRHTLGLFDPPGGHRQLEDGDADSADHYADHYEVCSDELTHLLLKLDDGCLGLHPAGLAAPDIARRLYYATDGRMRPLMNLVRVAGSWALEADRRITLELLADAFELVGRTDDTLQAKTNPFELPTFTEQDCAEAERVAGQRLERVRVPVTDRVRRVRACLLRARVWRVNPSEQASGEPYPRESLTSYLRRMARHQFFADSIAYLRAGGVEWHQRSRDPDLLCGALLQQVAAFFGLELERAAMLTIHSHLKYLRDEDRGSLRWWAALTQRTRICDRCVFERPYGRIEWRLPVITECPAHRRPLLDECQLCGAKRDRSSRRWERFDCGHHVQRSTGADSLAVDLRVQQTIQASLGIGRTPPTNANVWLIRTALAQRPRPVDVQSARQSLRQLWVEQRRARLAWRGPAQALRVLEQRGERMYPTQREPAAAVGPLELVPPSLDDLRDIAARYGVLIREPYLAAPSAIATSNPPIGQTVAL